MSDKRYLGNIITDSPTEPSSDFSNSSAKGVWSLAEQLAYQKAGLWPVPGNFPLDIDDVFSTYLYTGNSSTQTITNGIDLAGEGGMVWVKKRQASASHGLYDTERGVSKLLISENSNTQATYSGVNAFYSSGFRLGSGNEFNQNSQTFASWTFRKAPKFFTCLTYTGDGVAGREIAHNLGSVPGCFILKATSTAGDWIVYHRGLSDPSNKALALQLAFGELDNTYFNDTDPTATHFVVGGQGLGINNSGVTYVAYLFAHNNGDGGFGPDGDQDVIKCGSFTTDGSSLATVDLGWEPQWVMYKRTDGTGDWFIRDVMRGWSRTTNNFLRANLSDAEYETTGDYTSPTPTGFQIGPTAGAAGSNQDYIYIAIRRGPLAVPEDATEVFAPNFYGTNGYVGYLGAPADMHLLGYRSGNSQNAITSSRLIQGNKALVTSSNGAEITTSSSWDNMSGVSPTGTTLTTLISWTWKRAPSFFDVVAYTNTGNYAAQPHSLGVVPELVIMKRRSGSIGMDWYVTGFQSGKYLQLNSTAAESDVGTTYTTHTATHFKPFNESDCIAYLFASAPGVSKVGSYTGTGNTLNIDCGFTSGARFVLIKRTDNQSPWWLWDSERGIVAGNDPFLELNSSSAETTNTDYIDPYSAGFSLTADGNWLYGMNYPSGSYIFYAIA